MPANTIRAVLLPLLLIVLAVAVVNAARDDTCRLLCVSCERSKTVFAAQCPNTTCSCLQQEQSTLAPTTTTASTTQAPETTTVQEPCPPVEWADSVYCPNGFTRDANGCATGACAQPSNCPSATQWARKCGPLGLACPQGHRLDDGGCATCDCLGCPLPQLPPCASNSSVRCDLTPNGACITNCTCVPLCQMQQSDCKNDCGELGFEQDTAGCQLSCKCRCPPSDCPSNSECIGGYDTDRYGCRFCRHCVAHDANPWWCFGQPPKCANSCGSSGYRRSPDGCQIDCECHCPQLPSNCPTDCLWGRAKDAFGCDTCRCVTLEQHQSMAHCTMPQWLHDSCSKHCKRRFGNSNLQLDDSGCYVCKCCAKRKCSIPTNCPFGEVSIDRKGCPRCECRHGKDGSTESGWY